MANDSIETGAKPLPIARIALIVAALIALIAVGFSVWKRQKSEAPPVESAQALGGDISTVIAKLEARLKANPQDVEGWQMLGTAFFESGKYGESAQAYARATQLAPKNASYWSALGEARVMASSGTSFNPDAKAAFTSAVQNDPKDPRARYFLAVAKDMEGDHKGAVDAWFALLADTPAGAPWEADVRRVIAEVGGKEKINVADRLAAIKPVPPSGGAAIASAGIPGPTPEQLRSGGALPKGQQDAMIDGMVNGLEAKLKANPNNAEGWIMLMRSRSQLGQAAKASEALRSAKAAFAGDAVKRGQIEAAAGTLGIGG
jgi:cytochrome c-type biogenesis protein CcmH